MPKLRLIHSEVLSKQGFSISRAKRNTSNDKLYLSQEYLGELKRI